MGTVVTDLRLDNKLENIMWDALKDFDQIDNYKEKTIEGEIVRELKKGAFAEIYMKKVYNKKITVLASPKFYYRQLPKFRLILHLSQFRNLHMVWLLLVELFKEELASYIYCVAVIVRLDAWYDSKNGYKACLRAFYRKKIGATEEFKAGTGNRKGTYMGSKQSPTYYYVYQKMKKLFDGFDITRIEKRYKNKACPIKHLSEYPKLLKITVFDDLMIFIPKVNFKRTLANKKSTLSPKVVLFLKEYFDDGLQCARKEFSRDKAFLTEIWLYFISNCDLVSLNPYYHARLDMFVTSKEIVWC